MRELPERKRSPRLDGWDYRTSGQYFVTICTHEKHLLFGTIDNNLMHLNEIGQIVRREWLNIPQFYSTATIDEFIIMPNHLHGIIILKSYAKATTVGSRLCRDRYQDHASHSHWISRSPEKPKHLSRIIGNFKSYSSKYINKSFGEQGNSIWQKSYHDHIIRSQAEFHRIREYIRQNPMNWARDPDRR